MKVTRVSPVRILIQFPSKKEMNLTLYRISEFYEGAKGLKGRYFSSDQFLDVWSDEKGEIKRFGKKKEGYFAFWDGYNIPMEVIINFALHFSLAGALSKREQEFLSKIMTMPKDGYVIACVEGDKTTLKHETAHALFFENSRYCAEATKIVASLPIGVIAAYQDGLDEMHYIREVYVDETQAYLVAYDREEHEEVFPHVDRTKIAKARRDLNKLFKECS